MIDYSIRKENFAAQSAKFRKKYNAIANIRLLIFLLTMGGVFFLFSQGQYGWMLLLVLPVLTLFIFFIRFHQKILWQRSHADFLSLINENERKRLDHQFSHLPDGQEFAESTHGYATDLDLFGKNSLFQLINRTSTLIGAGKLAQWLKNPAEKQEIIQRQEAIRELAPKIDFCQDFQATGMHANDMDTETFQSLNAWLKTPASLSESNFWKGIRFLMPVLSLACIGLAILIDYRFVLLPLFINSLLLRMIFKTVQHAYQSTYQSVRILKAISLLLKKLEEEKFESPKNLGIQQKVLVGNHQKASMQINGLASILYYFGQRFNVYFSIIANGFFLWDVFWLIRLEQWKKKHQPDLEQWFEAIAEMESLISLAGLHQSNPDFTFPKISEQHFHISAIQLGHPLIPAHKRVPNDLTISGIGNTILITGSNMSGKTTFQRTLGVNCILALCGAPVCASMMEISPLQVFTSMRTQDSLEENVSSFYAELKRIRQLIGHLDQAQPLPVLYLLDEILKGTNSEDRHRGAKALILQLHETDASGLVSTHDLVLGAMENEYGYVKNYSFNSEIIGEEIIFDYKLQPGVCRSFNASKLMQQMGIRITT